MRRSSCGDDRRTTPGHPDGPGWSLMHTRESRRQGRDPRPGVGAPRSLSSPSTGASAPDVTFRGNRYWIWSVPEAEPHFLWGPSNAVRPREFERGEDPEGCHRCRSTHPRRGSGDRNDSRLDLHPRLISVVQSATSNSCCSRQDPLTRPSPRENMILSWTTCMSLPSHPCAASPRSIAPTLS